MDIIGKRTNLFGVICKYSVKTHWQTVLFAILYIVSLSVGAVLYFFLPADTYEQLCRLCESYFHSRSHWESISVFISSFLSVFWFLLLFYLLGGSPAGKILMFPLILFRGLGGGLAIAAICFRENHGALYPVPLLIQTLLFFGVGHALWTEREKEYRTGFLLLTLLSAAAALLDALLSIYPGN
jgi:hypothetical protein